MDIYTTIFEIILLPLLGALVSLLVAYLKVKRDECLAKVDNETHDKYVTMLHQTIHNCVVATNQTYVEALKKQGSFDAEAQKYAFNQTKDAVLTLLSAEAQVYLMEALGDLNAYIDTYIETAVNCSK